jgi:hypothetical protein
MEAGPGILPATIHRRTSAFGHSWAQFPPQQAHCPLQSTAHDVDGEPQLRTNRVESLPVKVPSGNHIPFRRRQQGDGTRQGELLFPLRDQFVGPAIARQKKLHRFATNLARSLPATGPVMALEIEGLPPAYQPQVGRVQTTNFTAGSGLLPVGLAAKVRDPDLEKRFLDNVRRVKARPEHAGHAADGIPDCAFDFCQLVQHHDSSFQSGTVRETTDSQGQVVLRVIDQSGSLRPGRKNTDRAF